MLAARGDPQLSGKSSGPPAELRRQELLAERRQALTGELQTTLYLVAEDELPRTRAMVWDYLDGAAEYDQLRTLDALEEVRAQLRRTRLDWWRPRLGPGWSGG
jgi:hypothetical protein